MELFLAEPQSDDTWLLGPDETRHCVRTLRHRVGDVVHAIDGQGMAAQCRIDALTDTAVHLAVLQHWRNFGEPPVETHLLFPLLKHKERTEWILEKAVELGVTHLHPVRYERSEPLGLPSDRARRILVAAVKQCLRSRIPQVSAIRPLAQVVKGAALPALRFGFQAGTEQPFTAYLPGASGQAIALVVGPEGDFTPAEVEVAQAAGFAFVSLGGTRLRAETAAVHVLSLSKAAQGF